MFVLVVVFTSFPLSSLTGGRISPGSLHLIEYSAIGEMDILGFFPAAKDFIDSEKFYLRELHCILGDHFLITWAIVVLSCDILSFR